MSKPTTRTDRDLSSELRQLLSEAMSKNRPYNRFTNTLFLFLLQSISFTVKIFVRKGIGRLTYSIFTIVAAYFWVRYFMGGDIDILRMQSSELVNTDTNMISQDSLLSLKNEMSRTMGPEAAEIFSTNSIETLKYKDEIKFLLGLLAMIISQFGVLIYHGLQWLPPTQDYLIVYIFSYIVVLQGLILLWKSRFEYFKRENHDPLSRGESVIFHHLEGREYKSFKITQKVILMWMDPIAVILIGLMFWLVLSNGNFGILIMFSGLILFWEERAVQNRDQKAVLTKLATDMWTERVLNEYKEFKGENPRSTRNAFGSVEFADEEDLTDSLEAKEYNSKENNTAKAGFG